MPKDKTLAEKLEESSGPISIDAIDPYLLQNKALHETIRELEEKLEIERGKATARLAKAKHCPFCGSLPTTIADDCSAEWGDSGPAVACGNNRCNALGPIKRSRKAALAAWNTRSTK